MEIGVSTKIIAKNQPILALNLQEISKNAKIAEIWLAPPFFPGWRTSHMSSDLIRCQEVADTFKLKVQTHAPHHDINPASCNPKIRKTAFEEIKKSLEASDILCSKFLTIHPGNSEYGNETTDENILETLGRLNDIAKNYECKLCLENTLEFNLEKIFMLTKKLKNIHITYDIAHQFSPPKKYSKKIINTHISDMMNKKHPHIPIGNGNVEIEKSIKYLIKNKYGGSLIIESFDCNLVEEIKKIKKFFRLIVK